MYEITGIFYYDSPTGFSYLENNNEYSIIEHWTCDNTSQGRLSNSKTLDIALQIYPNPTKGKVFINLQEHFNRNPVISIYDVTGKQVKRVQAAIDDLFVSVLELDISDFAKGLYLVKLKSNDTILMEKLLVE